MKRRWIVVAGSICALLAAPVLAAEWLYHRGLAMVDALPSPPPTEGLSEALVQLAWLEFEGTLPIAVERTGPLRMPIALALGDWPNRRGRHGMARGFRLAFFCARNIVRDHSGEWPGQAEFHLEGASVAIWLGRNWSTEEIIACALNGGYYGQSRMGIEAAASGYFGKPAADLAHDEVAVLMVALRAPSQFEPYCDPTALGDDVGDLLTRLQLEAAQSNLTLNITRRLSYEVWFGGRIRCVLPQDIDGTG